ncbi:hypothetical protein WMY93_006915 [Mugilogobius chulae]|uniref:Uncharacterized protein n=1 Tax=Mugilogobius chulae TaxID=88201 RepID=A0AAW0PLW7_9GOBI
MLTEGRRDWLPFVLRHAQKLRKQEVFSLLCTRLLLLLGPPSGTQATVSTFSRGTVTEQPRLQLSSTPVKPSTSGYGERPQKRPRLDIEEEEQEESDENTSFSVPLPHDSSYEPGASITDMSDLTEMEDATEYQDAKYIVFESCLRELFENCPICKKHCQLQQRRCGTFVAYTQYCPHCSYSRKWQSQPIQGSTPVGNVQLSAAVYFSGASFVQLGKICKAMNLKVHQYVTFRRHARNFLEPAIYHKWKMDQSKVLEEVKTKGKIAVGSNEVGGSAYMEKEGLKRSLTLLESKSVQIDYIVTDRHTQVQKFLRDRGTTQYYDVWHLVKGLSKKLDALSKNKECEIVKKWLPGIKNHMYWAAASSKTGPEKVAKWTSLVNHVQDVHTHEDPLFPKCEHAVKVSRDPHKWFKPGTMALYKLEKMLLNKRILRDVAKLSSAYQTSSLESFHSVILRFTQRMLSSLHWNDVQRRRVTLGAIMCDVETDMTSIHNIHPIYGPWCFSTPPSLFTAPPHTAPQYSGHVGTVNNIQPGHGETTISPPCILCLPPGT